ncbi:hypothetical protein MAELSTROM_12 [Pseudoalteromonas phage Maelstrom]|uniref:hypothetical protein n=1 Tax=Pseudoalteromonas phage Maelstrom TaxID=2065202 RepID=UPI000CA25DED|nr:hypothetical protein PP584_gp12 [Pseudoalteromonas phage Maelstrom]AUG84932.1 hypothetical protein MAELSTROM_12 [Pseudoalteromonas phage Maelstrom]
MSKLLLLNEIELAAKPEWATHYYKDQPDYVLFESKDHFQWCCLGELKYLNPQGSDGINEASEMIEVAP